MGQPNYGQNDWGFINLQKTKLIVYDSMVQKLKLQFFAQILSWLKFHQGVFLFYLFIYFCFGFSFSFDQGIVKFLDVNFGHTFYVLC